ncbi:MAG: integrin alpha, partial [Candidatus Midichloria sp.]|nr:integrin alpha [Candidatus Midichloria sp.]
HSFLKPYQIIPLKLTSNWDLDSTNGVTISGISTSDYAGFSVASAGDINNDGKNDIIIGAYQAGLGDKEQVGQV